MNIFKLEESKNLWNNSNTHYAQCCTSMFNYKTLLGGCTMKRKKMTELGYMQWCTQMNICFLHFSKFRHILPTYTIKHPNIISQDFKTSQILSWFYTWVLLVATITSCWLSTILKHCGLEHAFLQHRQIHISLYHQINFEQIKENVQTYVFNLQKQ
jgi:hypothetical protein